MVLAPLYVVELRDTPLLSNWRDIALPLVLAAGASVTKFNGAVALAVVLALALAGHVVNRAGLTLRDWARSAMVALGVILLVSASWYGMKALDFIAGRDQPNTGSLQAATNAASQSSQALGHLVGAVEVIPGRWVAVVVVMALMVLTAPLRRARWVSLGIASYTVLWALYLGYDFRNEFIVVPFVAYIASLGIVALVHNRFGASCDLEVDWESGLRTGRPMQLAIVVVLALGVVVASAALPQRQLVAHELAEQRRLGVPDINDAMYSLDARSGGLRGRILTDYAYLQVLPGFRNNPIRVEHNEKLTIDFVEEHELRASDMKGSKYLLLSDSPAHPDVNAAVQKGLADRAYSLVFSADGATPGPAAYAERVTVQLLRVNE